MPNIAIIVLDTLRKDAFDRHFEWLPGTSFENAWSTSHWTVPAHGSLFTGLYPTETGVRSRAEVFDFPEQSLIESLSEHGYRTTAYSCNPYISEQYDFDRGFDRFEEGPRVASARPEIFDWGSAVLERSGPRLWRYAGSIVECFRDSESDFLSSLRHGYRLKWSEDDGAKDVRRWVEEESWGDNEFLFVNLMEAHTPYTPPEEYRTIETDPDFDPILATATNQDVEAEQFRQAYDDSVRYLSDIYQDIFNDLSEDFDYIITVGDHGELLGEYGEWTHFHGIYPELTKVPLSVYTSEQTERSIKTPVSIIDVPATIADITNIDYATQGVSLFDDLSSRSLLVESYGLTHTARKKLQRNGISESRQKELDGMRQGISLSPNYYGYETDTGFESVGQSADDDPESILSGLVSELNKREVDETSNTIPENVKQQLEDLGYA